jgi:hypothetical protein
MSCQGSGVSCSFVNSQSTCEELQCTWMVGLGCSETANSRCRNVRNTNLCNDYGCTWVGAPSPGSATTIQNAPTPSNNGGLPTTARIITSTAQTTTSTTFGNTGSAPVADGGLIAGAVVRTTRSTPFFKGENVVQRSSSFFFFLFSSNSQVGALFIAVCLAAAIYTTVRERTRRKSENIIQMPRVDAAPNANVNAVPVQPALPPENPEFTRQYAASAPPPASQPEYMRTTNVGW